MPLHIKCRCGKALKIHARQANKKLTCPHCKHPFRIPAERFPAEAPSAIAESPTLTKMTAAAPPPPTKISSPTSKPGLPSIPVHAATPPVEVFDPQPVSLDQELLSGELVLESDRPSGDIFLELADDAAHAKSEGAPVPVVVEDLPQTLGYATDGRARKGGKAYDVVEGPKRGFWIDVFYSFVYPVRNLNNIITLVIIMAISSLRVFLVGGMCLTGGASFTIFGWLTALYFSVIQDTASGLDDLPGIKMQDGFWDDIVRPAFKFIGAMLLVFAPAIIFLALLGTGVVSSGLANLSALWFLSGVFMMPIILLMFAFDSMNMLGRPDLILSSIGRAFLPYLGLWAILIIVGILSLVTSLAPLMAAMGLPSFIPKSWVAAGGTNLAVEAVLTMFNTYLAIVAMRAIGLYYLHFKEKFTLELE